MLRLTALFPSSPCSFEDYKKNENKVSALIYIVTAACETLSEWFRQCVYTALS